MYRASMCDVAFTANATPLGSYKIDTIRSHRHSAQNGTSFLNSAVSGGNLASFASGSSVLNTPATDYTGTGETAPKHTAYAPRIHV
ncbi:Uncharacterised protein [Pandoraea pnomenusa]|uniref:Uncharacterized protein n=1 Tax=Pandoraea pnomenusa TaxID=93220 RepID=A0A378YM25_9BURK|nr:Uncharacterised protein [Pandoraea pnomenusa]